jgi:hypothetical protein
MPDCDRCGHPHTWHVHYRVGDDCGACTDCPAYRVPAGRLRRALRRWWDELG